MKAVADYLNRWAPTLDRFDDILHQQARERLAKRAWPARSDEAWRYTSLGSLLNAELSLPEPAILPDANNAPYIWEIRDGCCGFTDCGQAGIKAGGLSDLVEDEELVATLLQTETSGSPFDLLNLAGLTDALVISVEAGVACLEPLRISYGFSSAGSVQHSLVVLKLGEGASCRLIEEELDSVNSYLNNRVLVQLAAGAKLTHHRLQLGQQGWQLGSLNVHLAAGADYELVQASLSSQLRRNDLFCHIDGEGAAANLKGAFFSSNKGQLDNHLTLTHSKSGGSSEVCFNGLATDKGKGVFNGRIVIDPNSPKTRAQLQNHNLLLSPEAEIDTKPELEIYTDDVQCAHGATVGQISDEAIFYLLSRGISESEARQMLANGFVNKLLTGLEQEAGYQKWLKALQTGIR